MLNCCFWSGYVWFLCCTLLVSFCYIISALHYRIRWWFILSKLSWWFWFCLLGFMVPLVWHFSNQSLCPLVCCTCTTYVVWSTISRKCFPKSILLEVSKLYIVNHGSKMGFKSWTSTPIFSKRESNRIMNHNSRNILT